MAAPASGGGLVLQHLALTRSVRGRPEALPVRWAGLLRWAPLLRWVFLALWGLMLAGVAPAACAQVPVPPLQARVTDLTATLTTDQKAGLERRLALFEQRKGSQIAILLLPTTHPEPIEAFSIRVAEAWKIGRGRASNQVGSAAIDDGVLVVVALSDRRMRIEVGYGLEGAIPDAVAKGIVSDLMAPRFRDRDFAGGLNAALDALMARIEGESLPAPGAGSGGSRADGSSVPKAGSGSGSDLVSDLLPVILVGFFVGLVASQLFGRILGGLVGAGMGGFGATTVVSSWFWGVPVGLILFVLILLIGGSRGQGRGMRSVGGRRNAPPWVIPSGGWSSGSGGGWGGGGGGFGGGGASGDW